MIKFAPLFSQSQGRWKKRLISDLADEISYVVAHETEARHSYVRQAVRRSWMDKIGLELDFGSGEIHDDF